MLFSISSRGELDVQFNWIFVLIAGGVIFLFMFSVVEKQKAYSEEKTNILLLRTLDTIIFTSGSEKNIIKSDVPVSSTGLEFSCVVANSGSSSSSGSSPSSSCDCGFQIGDQRRSLRLPTFASSSVSGRSLQLWSLSWDVPFHATNLLFVVSPNVKYYVSANNKDDITFKNLKNLYNSRKSDGISDDFITFISSDTVVTDASDVFVLKIGEDASTVTSSGSSKIKTVTLNINNINNNKILFSSSLSPASPSSYSVSTDEELFAALFSADSSNVYSCGMKKAFSRVEDVGAVLQNRISKIDNARKVLCSSLDANKFNDILTNAKELSSDLNYVSNSNPTIPSFKSVIAFLVSDNNLLRRQSCPSLY